MCFWIAPHYPQAASKCSQKALNTLYCLKSFEIALVSPVVSKMLYNTLICCTLLTIPLKRCQLLWIAAKKVLQLIYIYAEKICKKVTITHVFTTLKNKCVDGKIFTDVVNQLFNSTFLMLYFDNCMFYDEQVWRWVIALEWIQNHPHTSRSRVSDVICFITKLQCDTAKSNEIRAV